MILVGCQFLSTQVAVELPRSHGKVGMTSTAVACHGRPRASPSPVGTRQISSNAWKVFGRVELILAWPAVPVSSDHLAHCTLSVSQCWPPDTAKQPSNATLLGGQRQAGAAAHTHPRHLRRFLELPGVFCEQSSVRSRLRGLSAAVVCRPCVHWLHVHPLHVLLCHEWQLV